ncbi:MAG TPA: DUF4157 domain-containing protein, partial [Terriglobales bacterium]|nr:DUF4157 domain-containing protein [Terriglobales bacterium]
MSYATFATKNPKAAGENATASSRTAPADLRMGEPDDAFEREADRIAEEIMSGGMLKCPRSLLGLSMGTPLQRKCACGGSGGSAGECEECKKKREDQKVQRKDTGPAAADFAPPLVHEALHSPGEPLDVGTRGVMESRFRNDFSKVRVHVDNRAAQSAKAVNALAYTVGSDIVFGAGQYLPHTGGGQKLIAHELSHVIQQSGLHGQPDASLRVSDAGEVDADRAASDIASGGSAGPIVPVRESAVQRDDLDEAFKYIQRQGLDDQTYASMVRQGVSLQKSVEQTHWASPEAKQRFIQGYLRYTKAHGLDKEHAEAATAYPRSGSTQAQVPAWVTPPAPGRQQATGTPHVPPARGGLGVHPAHHAAPFEKSSESVESMYWRAGLVEAANAVRKCREGDCSHVLTEQEAYNAYRTGRVSAGMGDPVADKAQTSGQKAPLAAAGLAAPLATPGGEAAGTAAKTALERAVTRWGTAEVIEGGGAAATAPGAAIATVAVPVALGVYMVVAAADLIGYTSFQKALHRLGSVILPNALGVCIAGCHQPTAPVHQPFEPRLLPPEGQGMEKLRPWEETPPTEATRRRQGPAQQPTSQPVPQAPPKSRRCTDAEVDRLHNAMKKECDKVRGCNMQTDTCATATSKVAAFYACITAR